MMQQPKIAFFGLFGVGNFGNEASLEAMIQFVRQQAPNAELSCICASPTTVTADHQIPAFPIDIPYETAFFESSNILTKIMRKLVLRIPMEIYLWFKAYQYLRHIDLMIIPGTGILDDFGMGPFQMPYDLLKWALVSRVTKTKLAFASIGAGPIMHPLNRLFMKSAVALADYRSYRDHISKDFMESINFNTEHDSVYPDLVFGLKVNATPRNPDVQKTPKVIGIGVMDYYGWSDSREQGEEIYQTYIDKLTDFVAWLLEQDYDIRFLIGQWNDQNAVRDIMASLDKRQTSYRSEQIVSAGIDSIQALFAQVAQTDIVVATRFHNVLCSLMLNRPVVSLGYAKKNDVLMAEMGMGDFCQHIEDFDVNLLREHFAQLIGNRAQFVQQMEQKNIAYQAALHEQTDYIINLAMTHSAVASTQSA